MQVLEAMNPRERLITAPPSLSILEAMDLMVVNRIGSLVITDDDENVIGFVSARDLMSIVILEGKNGLDHKISDIMAIKLLTVNENDLLKNAVVKMEENRTHHILVRDNEGNISGILSSFDIIRENSFDILKIQ